MGMKHPNLQVRAIGLAMLAWLLLPVTRARGGEELDEKLYKSHLAEVQRCQQDVAENQSQR